jgi:hypothetical protein
VLARRTSIRDLQSAWAVARIYARVRLASSSSILYLWYFWRCATECEATGVRADGCPGRGTEGCQRGSAVTQSPSMSTAPGGGLMRLENGCLLGWKLTQVERGVRRSSRSCARGWVCACLRACLPSGALLRIGAQADVGQRGRASIGRRARSACLSWTRSSVCSRLSPWQHKVGFI